MLSKGDVLMYLAESGGNRGKAAVLAGVSVPTFRSALKKHKVKAPDTRARLSRQDLGIVRALHGCGASESGLASMFGVHRNTISKVCRMVRV